MSRRPNQKYKLLSIYLMLKEETNESHGLTVEDIIERLEEDDIAAERKSIYDDIHVLRDHFNLDIVQEKTKNKNSYKLLGRTFEVADVLMLKEAVSSSRYLTEKKAAELDKKLMTLLAKEDRKQVYLSNVSKNPAKSIVNNSLRGSNLNFVNDLNSINMAITKDHQVRFQYRVWNLDGELVPKKDGDFYQVSPWRLIQDNGEYYMVAYDSLENKLKHYRIDKMYKVSVVEEKRLGRDEFYETTGKNYGIGYANVHFNMYGSDTFACSVRLKCKNSLSNVMFDRFGKDIKLVPVSGEEDSFVTSIRVVLSDQFYGWVMSFGDEITILSPDEAVDGLKALLKSLNRIYI